MKVSFREAKDRSASFVLEGSDPSFVNALRRTMIMDVPKLAIEDVEFHLGPIRAEDGKEHESITPLFDEIVAHRLGLVPLPTDLKAMNIRATCPSCHGEGCPQCTVIYAINKRGPGYVMSSDLEPIGDPKLKAVDPNIPIVKLGDGQAMLIYATAQLGMGRDHAKWQAASGAAYTYYPTLALKGKKKEVPLEGNVCEDHSRALEERGEGALKDIAKCEKCKVAGEAAKGDLTVGGDPTRFVFHLETDGSLSTKEVLLTASDILVNRFTELAKQVDALE